MVSGTARHRRFYGLSRAGWCSQKMLEWLSLDLGEEIDPKVFSIDEANYRLSHPHDAR